MSSRQNSRILRYVLAGHWFSEVQKIEVSVGPFQIAMPHVELNNNYISWVLISSSARIGDRLGLRVERKGKEKDRERRRKEKEKEKDRHRKRNRKEKEEET